MTLYSPQEEADFCVAVTNRLRRMREFFRPVLRGNQKAMCRLHRRKEIPRCGMRGCPDDGDPGNIPESRNSSGEP